jgi:hypothetical protein
MPCPCFIGATRPIKGEKNGGKLHSKMALFHCLSDRSATSRKKIGEKMFKMKHYIREFHTQ